MSDFIGFPPAGEIVASLRQIGHAHPWQEALFQAIADRLGSRVYDGAACTFILLEVLHEYEDSHAEDLRRLLAQCVVALTRDRELEQTAVQSFDEIHCLLRDQPRRVSLSGS